MVMINGKNLKPRIGRLHKWVASVLSEQGSFEYSSRMGSYVSKELNIKGRRDLNNYLVTEALRVGFPPSGAKSAIIDWVQRMCRDAQEVYEKQFILDFCPDLISAEKKTIGTNNLRNLLYYMTGQKDQLDLLIMKQFLWSVKRNLCGMPIKHKMMPVWYGPQDTGKTTVANRLCQPLQGLTATATFELFSDKTLLQILTRLAVVILDELDRAKYTAIESVKKVISDGEHLQREFHSQDNFNFITVKTTFLALSNRPLKETIKDDEMRRFWQINVADYAWINQFWDTEIETMDWRSIWDCVCQNDAEPVDDRWSEIKATQIILSTKDSVTEFVTDCLEPGQKEHSGVDSWNLYLQWAARKGNRRPLTSTAFLVQFKKKVEMGRNGKGITYLFKEKEEDFDGTHELPVDPDTYYDPMDGPSDHEGAECEFD